MRAVQPNPTDGSRWMVQILSTDQANEPLDALANDLELYRST
ncbi:MAG TPA: hypothetical protein VF251_09600 [Pyrinomonadaceae bacterium]